LLITKLRKLLNNNKHDTLFIGKKIVSIKEVDSTNNYALTLLSEAKQIEGTIVQSAFQNNGKGQRGNNWESEPNKNITLSIILYPQFLSANNQFLLNQAISLGIFDFAKIHFGEQIKIKWPNDIYFEKRKLGGILIENSLQGQNISTSVIGIGININQTIFKTTSNATSFKSIANKEFDVDELVMQLCWYLEGRYLQLKTMKMKLLKQDYLNGLLFYQQKKEFEINREKITGKIVGISEQGRLIIEANQTLLQFDFKEIKFLL